MSNPPNHLVANQERVLEASRKGDTQVIKNIIDSIGPAERDQLLCAKRNDGNTALHLAAYNGQPEVFKVIIDSISPEQRNKLLCAENKRGNTAVHDAATKGQTEIIKMIVDSISPPEMYKLMSAKDCDGRAALHLAAHHEQPEVFKVIIDRINPEDRYRLLCADNNWNNTAAHDAAMKRDAEIIKMMVDSINPPEMYKLMSARNSDGYTVLDLGAIIGPPEVVATIIDCIRPEERYQLLCAKNSNGCTALHQAAYCKQPEVFKVIIDSINPEERYKLLCAENKWKNTAVHYAANQGQVQIIKMIVDRVSPLEMDKLMSAKNKFGDTALLLLSRRGYPEVSWMVVDSQEKRDELVCDEQDPRDITDPSTPNRGIPDKCSLNGGGGFSISSSNEQDSPDPRPAIQQNLSLDYTKPSGDESLSPDILTNKLKPTTKPATLDLRDKGRQGFTDPMKAAVVEPDTNDDFSDGEYLVVDPATYHIPIEVRKVTSQKVTELFKSKKVYPSTNPRGRALIINNWLFDQKESNPAWSPDQTELLQRDGTNMDSLNIKELLDQLCFITGDVKEDVSSTDFEKVIREEISHPDHWNYGAFILVIMTHGKDNEIFGADGRSYPLLKIVDLLSLKQFPAMGSKPKIVFLQACSGNRIDKQKWTSDGSEVHVSPPWIVEQSIDDMKANNMDDIAIVSSSFRGYDSKRHTEMGTWFIRAVVEVFMKHAHHKEFYELIKEVRRRVRNEGLKHRDVGGQTVTMREECLNRLFYFFPGL